VAPAWDFAIHVSIDISERYCADYCAPCIECLPAEVVECLRKDVLVILS